jgi:hypothetical protein
VVDVEQWAEIRRMHFVVGLSIKEIVCRTGRDRNTVRRALRSEEPPRYRRAERPSKLDPFREEIHRLLGERNPAVQEDVSAATGTRPTRESRYQHWDACSGGDPIVPRGRDRRIALAPCVANKACGPLKEPRCGSGWLATEPPSRRTLMQAVSSVCRTILLDSAPRRTTNPRAANRRHTGPCRLVSEVPNEVAA